MVGVEDTDDLAAGLRQRSVDVLCLRDRAFDADRLQPGIPQGDLVQLVLDRQRVRRVVGEDHLQVGVVLQQERLDGLDHGAASLGR